MYTTSTIRTYLGIPVLCEPRRQPLVWTVLSYFFLYTGHILGTVDFVGSVEEVISWIL